MHAYANRTPMDPPSARHADFDLAAAYAVEAERARWRLARGHAAIGRKVGFANKAMWRVLKLKTLLWAHMYDDTVQYGVDGRASVSVARMFAPKIEPEIVFKLKRPIEATDAEAVLDAVEWLALGFEIIDCVYPEWKFQPVDFVAAFGFHAALIVGPPRRVEPFEIPSLVNELSQFKVRLLKNGQLVEEGSGKKVLGNPALCLGELAAGLLRQPGAEPLAGGDLVSSGTLTTSAPIAPGETWGAEVDGIDLAPLTLHTIGPVI